MHEELVRLNDGVRRLNSVGSDGGLDDSVARLIFSPSRLVKFALDEEESMAAQHGVVYPNVIKLRLLALKKAKPETWLSELRTRFEVKPVDSVQE